MLFLHFPGYQFERVGKLLFNRIMLYILTNIYNLSQIEKLKPAVIQEIRQSFGRIMDIHKQVQLKEYGEIILLDIGQESRVDPQNALDISVHIKETLEIERESLVGYNIFILVSAESNYDNLITRYKKVFLALQEDEEIWIERELESFFRNYADVRSRGEYSAIAPRESAPDTTRTADPEPRLNQLSTREPLIAAIKEVLDREAGYQAVHLSGPAGSGKSLLLADILKSFCPEPWLPLVPHCHLRFHKPSAIHPLLNSIEHSQLEDTRRHLAKHEVNIWEEHGFILSYLKSTIMWEKCPDHIFEDFCICYNLYLTAYLRKMDENLYPAFFILDDFDRYPERTREYLSRLIPDFLTHPAFLPIFITEKSGTWSGEWAFLKRRTVKAARLSLKEIGGLARTRFHEQKLERTQLKELKTCTQGALIPVLQTLQYLEKQRQKEQALRLPEKQEQVLWSLINDLDKNTRDVLFSIYISGGLLPAGELVHFLIAFGLKRETIEQSIELLTHHFLIYQERFIVPGYPALRPSLEKKLGKRGSYLKGLIADFIMELWKQNKLSNPVLLFSFFMNNGRPAFAFELLAFLIKRKMDEHDLAGVKPYLNLKNFTFSPELSDKENHFLEVIIATARIRLFLLENHFRTAGEAVDQILQQESRFQPDLFHAELQLNLSRYYLVSGEIEKAVSNTKQTLLLSQDLGQRFLSGQAYKTLGYSMLIRGKMDDALEYFKLAEKFLDERRRPYERLQVFLSGAVAYYIKGELTKAAGFIARGVRTAALAGRRNYQLFFNFFQARIYFDYAAYDKAGILLQKNLTMSRIYNLPEAAQLTYRWIARVEIYRGNHQGGLRLLETLTPCREVLFFKSEALVFQNLFPEARQALEKALSLDEDPLPLSDETIYWSSGYNGIEGRSLAIFTGNSVFNRLLRAFYAYLLGRTGDDSSGIRNLHMITRTEKNTTLDPYNHFYFYLYASLLYQSAVEGKEDSLTILNKAVKELQERASKIDEPMERTRYLNKNYWNRQLLAEGRKRKLL